MKDASKKIIEVLALRGYRITHARTQVLETLSGAKTPLSIQTIAQKVDVDVVSVYRTIAMLIKEQLIEEVTIQGETTRYEIAHGHHHHVVCVGCNLLVHVPCGKKPIAPFVSGFAYINSHELTYYGMCTKCA